VTDDRMRLLVGVIATIRVRLTQTDSLPRIVIGTRFPDSDPAEGGSILWSTNLTAEKVADALENAAKALREAIADRDAAANN